MGQEFSPFPGILNFSMSLVFFCQFGEFCEIREFGEIRELQETRGFHDRCSGTGYAVGHWVARQIVLRASICIFLIIFHYY